MYATVCLYRGSNWSNRTLDINVVHNRLSIRCYYHTHTHTHTDARSIHTHIRTHTHMHTRTHTYGTYTYTHVHKYTHTHTHTRDHITHTRDHITHTHTHTHTHTGSIQYAQMLPGGREKGYTGSWKHSHQLFQRFELKCTHTHTHTHTLTFSFGPALHEQDPILLITIHPLK